MGEGENRIVAGGADGAGDAILLAQRGIDQAGALEVLAHPLGEIGRAGDHHAVAVDHGDEGAFRQLAVTHRSQLGEIERQPDGALEVALGIEHRGCHHNQP